jgi:uncharacterized protein YuzE
MVLVTYDVDAGATYVEFSEATVARTISVSDLVMVDLSADHHVVGVDFAVAPRKITRPMIDALVKRFPELDYLSDTDTWLLAPTP